MLYITKQVEDLNQAFSEHLVEVYRFLSNGTMADNLRWTKDEAAEMFCSGFLFQTWQDASHRVLYQMWTKLPGELMAKEKSPFIFHIETEDYKVVSLPVIPEGSR